MKKSKKGVTSIIVYFTDKEYSLLKRAAKSKKLSVPKLCEKIFKDMYGEKQ